MNKIKHHLMQSCGQRILILQSETDFNNFLIFRDYDSLIQTVDQFILLYKKEDMDCLRAYNRNYEYAENCGNGVLSAAAVLMEEKKSPFNLCIGDRNVTAFLEEETEGSKIVKVDMGVPVYTKKNIPIDDRVDDPMFFKVTTFYDYYADVAAVGMGNPHGVFFVNSSLDSYLGVKGEVLENHPVFPKGANISFVDKSTIYSSIIRARVWERGVGETPSCGTAACAIHAVLKARAIRKKNFDYRKFGSCIQFKGGFMGVDETDLGHLLLKSEVKRLDDC